MFNRRICWAGLILVLVLMCLVPFEYVTTTELAAYRVLPAGGPPEMDLNWFLFGQHPAGELGDVADRRFRSDIYALQLGLVSTLSLIIAFLTNTSNQ